MDEQIYKEFILDLYRHPLNKKVLADFDIEHKGTNYSCGDDIKIYLKFNENGEVADIGFQGQGCAISQAAASLLTEDIKGKTKKYLMNLKPDDILKLFGVDIIYSRKNCALLALNTLQEALNK